MRKFTALTALIIILSMFVTLAMPTVLAEDSLQEGSETSGESSEPQNPEKCHLTFSDPEHGIIDVAKGYVGFTYDDGTSVYTYKYGETAVLTLTPNEDTYFSYAELNGEDIAPVNNVLRIEMNKDYNLTVRFEKIEYKTVAVICEFGSLGSTEVTLTSGGSVFTESLKVLPGDTAIVGFSAKDGSDIYLSSADFLPDGGDHIETIIDNDANTVTTLPISCNGTLTLHFDSAPVNVTVNQTEGGTVVASKLTPKKGETITFTFTPESGYYLKCIVINGSEVTISKNTYDYTVTGDVTVSAVFALIAVDVRVTLSVTAGTDGNMHGKIVFENNSGTELKVKQGNIVYAIVTPDVGYEIDAIKINGVATNADENGKISAVADKDLAITVTFKIIQFRITAVVTAQGGGKITAEGYEITKNVVYIDYGDSVTFTFTPDMHYSIYSVKADSVTVFSSKDGGTLKDSSYAFTNVVANHTIAVTFASEGSVVTEYTISATAGDNGSITPSGDQTVVQGETVVYTIAPNDGYEVDYVAVDGIDVLLSGGTYTFTAVSSDHSIEAYFKEKPAGEDDGVINVEDINWSTSVITIDVTGTPTVDKAIFDKITSDCQGRTIVFKSSDFEISFTASSSFSTAETQLNLSSLRDIASPDYTSISAIITSNAQYSSSVFTVIKLGDIFPASSSAKVFVGNDYAGKLVSYYVYDSGELVRAEEELICDSTGYVTVTLKNSKELVFIAPETAAVTYRVTITAGENGVVTPVGDVTVNAGTALTFTATPNEGYKISRITAGDKTLDIDGTEYTVQITADTEIEVRFALENSGGSSKAGLVISIIIIAIALVGGGVLFVIKWKQTRY